MKKNSLLLSSIKIGTKDIPNRFVRSATHAFMATKDGFVTERQVSLLRNLALGGIGLIITGHAYVNSSGKAGFYQTAIDDDTFVEGLSLIPKAVHEYESQVFIQISHAGRQTTEKFCGCLPVAPSPIYEPVFKVKPREMKDKEIEATIKNFIQAAQRAKNAGFDGVQLHAAHGYLLSGFISPYTNLRSDKWGGTVVNRSRIIVRILSGIKKLLGKNYPVIIKLNSTDLLPKGLSVEESIEIAGILEENGLDGIEVSGGMSEAGQASVWKGPFAEVEEGYFIENAFRIKASVKVPVFGLGGLRSISVMEKAISEGKVDLISMSRPFIREPSLVNKLKSNESEKSECISCNKCFNLRGIRCAVLEKKMSKDKKNRRD